MVLTVSAAPAVAASGPTSQQRYPGDVFTFSSWSFIPPGTSMPDLLGIDPPGYVSTTVPPGASIQLYTQNYEFGIPPGSTATKVTFEVDLWVSPPPQIGAGSLWVYPLPGGPTLTSTYNGANWPTVPGSGILQKLEYTAVYAPNLVNSYPFGADVRFTNNGSSYVVNVNFIRITVASSV